MKHSLNLVDNERGSVIVIAMVVLALMTIIGVSATTMSTTESFIVRNVQIYKQNLHMVDAALNEAVEEAIGFLYDPNGPSFNLDPALATHAIWVNSRTAWDTLFATNWSGTNSDWFSGQVLNATNSQVPGVLVGDTGGLAVAGLLAERGEWNLAAPNPAASPLRCGLIGWEGAVGGSLIATGPARKVGRLVAEYVSNRFGSMRLEAGMEIEF